MSPEPGQIPVPRLPPGLDTPALTIDLDIVETNARWMAETMAARGIAVRPHTKTHKSVELARIQVAVGASGITVGTLGEAEVMAAAGIDDIFVAYPVWAGGPKAARVRDLATLPGLRLSFGIDSEGGARQLASAMRLTRLPLRVLIELDPGNGRTGIPPEQAGRLATVALELGLEVVGLFTHGGHAYAGPMAVADAAADEVAALTRGAATMRGAGLEPEILSAGSTPTALGAAAAPVTEMRPGTYLLGDRIQVALGSPPDSVAIAIAATVVSTSVPGQVVIDAGAKTLTKDLPPYIQGYGGLPAYPGSILERVSDYHGVVRIPDGAPSPGLGEVVAVIPNHACPVVDLHDSFVAHRSGEVVGVWPVDARGRSR